MGEKTGSVLGATSRRPLGVAAHRELLAGIAQAARGTAHALNNALWIMDGNLSMIRDTVWDAELREKLDDVLAALDRADRLSRNLSAIAYFRPFTPERVNVGERLRCKQDSFRELLDAGVSLTLDIDDSVPSVMTDPAYFELAVNAAVINANEATDGRGAIRVACAGHGSSRRAGDPVPSSDRLRRSLVMVSVSDSGKGIQPQTIRRAFEPGFTTRSSSHAGLGLWFVREFALSSGGQARIENNRQTSGSVLTITLPADRRPAAT